MTTSHLAWQGDNSHCLALGASLQSFVPVQTQGLDVSADRAALQESLRHRSKLPLLKCLLRSGPMPEQGLMHAAIDLMSVKHLINGFACRYISAGGRLEPSAQAVDGHHSPLLTRPSTDPAVRADT